MLSVREEFATRRYGSECRAYLEWSLEKSLLAPGAWLGEIVETFNPLALAFEGLVDD